MERNGNPTARSAADAKANRAVLVIALAQLLGTSLWFSANGATPDLQATWHLSTSDIGWLTNAVQAGFVVGTIASAGTGVADRVSASRVFAACGLLGATLNVLFALASAGLASAIAFRFGVGVTLAGIYPLGMKLLVSWAPGRSAQTLALLVAMLTLGTASVHGIRAAFPALPWQAVVLSSSVLAVVGAMLVLFLGEGSHGRQVHRVRSSLTGGMASVVRIAEFRFAAFGYFGHMWELYAFWTLTPLFVQHAFGNAGHPLTGSIALWSFLVIAVGAAGCLAGGKFGMSLGSARIAALALSVSGALCAIYPLASDASTPVQLSFLMVWGFAVNADSPQFSALSVRACPGEKVGGALTLQNGAGFLLSACSIVWSTSVFHSLGPRVTWLLLPGPLLGLLAMRPLLAKRPRW
jgi:MFS family permease